ncbi:MAG TPA: zinc ribbon domain-containing protein [Anaerolineales bacterium]|nr:zinc ribbon domain-containing protein [Anaerolineales bacterium]
MTDPSFLSNFALILTAWGAAFLAALWLSLLIWTYRDIRRRARDPFTRILAVLVVAVLFLPGIVIYLILRPARTLEDEYQQTLEEEALLQSIEESQLCPGCGRRVREGWVVCPNCHTKVKKACLNCGKLLELPWNLCPYCATPTPGMRRADLTLDKALDELPAGEEAVENNLPETPYEPTFTDAALEPPDLETTGPEPGAVTFEDQAESDEKGV